MAENSPTPENCNLSRPKRNLSPELYGGVFDRKMHTYSMFCMALQDDANMCTPEDSVH